MKKKIWNFLSCNMGVSGPQTRSTFLNYVKPAHCLISIVHRLRGRGGPQGRGWVAHGSSYSEGGVIELNDLNWKMVV
jgi:hypothetical protein